MNIPYEGRYSGGFWSLGSSPIEPGPAVAARPYPGERTRIVVNEPPATPPTSEEILAVADELDGTDADSAFVAEVMRDAVADTAPAGAVGWLARIVRRWFR